jgi:hypothetical protein
MREEKADYVIERRSLGLWPKRKIIKQLNIIRNESEKEKGISLSFEVGRVLKKKLRAPAPLTDLDLISIGKRFE